MEAWLPRVLKGGSDTRLAKISAQVNLKSYDNVSLYYNAVYRFFDEKFSLMTRSYHE